METASFENSLREGLRLQQTAEPCVVVIFGASGDLTKRKLVPALYSLAWQNLLAGGFSIVGAARTPMTHDAFRVAMRDAISQFSETDGVDPAIWENFAAGLFYNSLDPQNPEGYKKLSELLIQVNRERGTLGNRLFYLSTPPNLYSDIVRLLGAMGLNRSIK